MSAVAERKQARIIADAEKRNAKPYVLVINEQIQALGDKFRTQTRTQIRYSSVGSLKTGLKRRYPGVEWKKAANGVSFIFAETGDRKRIQVLAYREQQVGYSVQMDLGELCNGITKQ